MLHSVERFGCQPESPTGPMDTRPPATPLAATHLESSRTKSPRHPTPTTRLKSHPYISARSIPFRITSLQKTPGGRVRNHPYPNLTAHLVRIYPPSLILGGSARDLDPTLRPRRPLAALHPPRRYSRFDTAQRPRHLPHQGPLRRSHGSHHVPPHRLRHVRYAPENGRDVRGLRHPLRPFSHRLDRSQRHFPVSTHRAKPATSKSSSRASWASPRTAASSSS